MISRPLTLALFALLGGSAHAIGQKAAQVVGFKGTVYLIDAPGAKERRLKPNERPWVYHRGKIRIAPGGSVTLLYTNASKPETIHQSCTVSARLGGAELAQRDEYNKKLRVGVRVMAGPPALIFPGNPIPASFIVLMLLSDDPSEVLVGTDGTKFSSVDGRIDDAAFRALLVRAAAEGRTKVRMQLVRRGYATPFTIDLASPQDDAALVAAIAAANRIEDATQRHLARARAFESSGLAQYALYEAIRARTVTKDSPEAAEIEKRIRETYAYPIAPPKDDGAIGH